MIGYWLVPAITAAVILLAWFVTHKWLWPRDLEEVAEIDLGSLAVFVIWVFLIGRANILWDWRFGCWIALGVFIVMWIAPWFVLTLLGSMAEEQVDSEPDL